MGDTVAFGGVGWGVWRMDGEEEKLFTGRGRENEMENICAGILVRWRWAVWRRSSGRTWGSRVSERFETVRGRDLLRVGCHNKIFINFFSNQSFR